MDVSWVDPFVFASFIFAPYIVLPDHDAFCRASTFLFGALPRAQNGRIQTSKGDDVRILQAMRVFRPSMTVESARRIIRDASSIIDTRFDSIVEQVKRLIDQLSLARQTTPASAAFVAIEPDDSGSSGRFRTRLIMRSKTVARKCAVLVWMKFLWADMVQTLGEVPPGLVTAIVRAGLRFEEVFPRIDTTELCSHPMWLERSICVGFYRIGMNDHALALCSDDHGRQTVGCGDDMYDVDDTATWFASSGDTMHREEPQALEDDELSWLDTQISDLIQDINRHDETSDAGFSVGSKMRGDDTDGGAEEERFMDISELDADVLCGRSSDGWYNWRQNDLCSVGGESGDADEIMSMRSDSVRSRATEATVSSYASVFAQGKKRCRENMYAFGCTGHTRVDAIVDYERNHTRMMGVHPYTMTACMMSICNEFAFVLYNTPRLHPHTTDCDVCGIALCDELFNDEIDALASGTACENLGSVLYQRIHTIVCNPTYRTDMDQRGDMSKAKASRALYGSISGNAYHCQTCDFVTMMVQFVSANASLMSAIGTDDESLSGVQAPTSRANVADLIDVAALWTDGMAFFRDAYHPFRINPDKSVFCNDIMRRGESFMISDDIDRVTRLFQDHPLPSEHEDRAHEEFCTITVPAAASTMVIASLNAFSTNTMFYRPGALRTMIHNDGKLIDICVHKEDLAVIQKAMVPLVSLGNMTLDASSLSQGRLRRCSGVPMMIRNMLCGNDYELYLAMQWIRRCSFKRSLRGGAMFGPQSPHLCLYRMLPRLLSCVDGETLVNHFVRPYRQEGKLFLRHNPDKVRRDRIHGAELFFSDTVDLRRVTHDIGGDMEKTSENPAIANIIPRRYDLRHIRDRQHAARYIRRSNCKEEQSRRLYETYVSELTTRRRVLDRIGEYLYVGKDKSKSKSTMFDECRTRLRSKKRRNGIIEVASMLARIQPQKSRSGDSDDPAKESLSLKVPRRICITPPRHGDDTDIYASLYAFLVPVGTRVCVAANTLNSVWESLLTNEHLWSDHRFLAAMLMEMFLSSRRQRGHILCMYGYGSNKSSTKKDTAVAAPWIRWIFRRRKYVYDRLGSTCFRQESVCGMEKEDSVYDRRARDHWKEFGADQPARPRENQFSALPYWRVFEDDLGIDNAEGAHFYSECASECAEVNVDSCMRGMSTKGERQKIRRGFKLAKEWCDCERCHLVSSRVTVDESQPDHHRNSPWYPVPPFPFEWKDETRLIFTRSSVASKRSRSSVPDGHVLLPKSIVSFPDLDLPLHYLLYHFAVDPRVGASVRQEVFLGIKVAPTASQIECISPNNDGTTTEFLAANRALQLWSENCVAEGASPIDLHDELVAGLAEYDLQDYDRVADTLHMNEYDVASMIRANSDKISAARALEQAQVLLLDPVARNTAYEQWLGACLMEWHWQMSRFPSLNANTYRGINMLRLGNAIPLDSMCVVGTTVELLARLEMRSITAKSLLRSDSVLYEAVRDTIAEKHTRCVRLFQSGATYLRQNHENEEERDIMINKLRASIMDKFKQFQKQVLEASVDLGHQYESARNVLDEQTMREDVTFGMVVANMPIGPEGVRELLVGCILDSSFCPPVLTEEDETSDCGRATMAVDGTLPMMYPKQLRKVVNAAKFQPTTPAKCARNHYSARNLVTHPVSTSVCFSSMFYSSPMVNVTTHFSPIDVTSDMDDSVRIADHPRPLRDSTDLKLDPVREHIRTVFANRGVRHEMDRTFVMLPISPRRSPHSNPELPRSVSQYFSSFSSLDERTHACAWG